MKISDKYFKPIGLLVVLAMMVVSCTEFEEFQSKTYGSGPTITLAQVSVQDSTFTVSVTSNADGYASVILLPGTGNTPPEDPEDLATGNINALAYQSKEVAANTARNFTFSGLVQDAAYEVMAVGTNLDGKYSDVSTLAVGTDDTHPPMLLGTSPGVTYSPVLAVDGPVVLVFDEPVIYDDTKDLIFTEFLDGVNVAAASVTVDGSEVTVTPGENFTNLDYAMLSVPTGAFRDYSGNLSDTIASYYDAGADELVGLYWRVESMDFEPTSITPVEEVVPTAFDIVVTFAEAVSAAGVADGDITLTYDDGRDVLIRSVLASEVSAAGNELTITQSYSAAPGVQVTVNIPAEVLSIGYGNPNVEISASWIIELTLADLAGTYTVNAVSITSPGVYDEVWTATVAVVPGNDTALSITIDAGIGGGVAFLAGFDVDALTVLIPEASEAGNIYGQGSTLIMESDANTYLGGDVHGTITGANSFTTALTGIWLPDYDWGDGTFGAFWDSFNATWTKSAKKAAAATSIPPNKATRFK